MDWSDYEETSQWALKQRREQGKPDGVEDEQTIARLFQLLKPVASANEFLDAA